MLSNYSGQSWKPVRDFCFVRELPVEQKGLIIPGIDLNRSSDYSPVLYGVVEAIGPRVTDVRVGDRVAFEIGAGEFRLPGDDMVRIMYEADIAWVEIFIPEETALITQLCEECITTPTRCPGVTVLDTTCPLKEVAHEYRG